MNTWEILAMNCKTSENGLTNVVESVLWKLTSTTTIDGTEYPLTSPGLTNLPSPTPEEFTDYDSLTKEQVVEWVEANTDVNEVITRLEQQLVERLNPTHVTLQPPF
jgi:hypothetical protein